MLLQAAEEDEMTKLALITAQADAIRAQRQGREAVLIKFRSVT